MNIDEVCPCVLDDMIYGYQREIDLQMVDLMKNATNLIPIDFSTWADKPINQRKALENFINRIKI